MGVGRPFLADGSRPRGAHFREAAIGLRQESNGDAKDQQSASIQFRTNPGSPDH